MHECSEKVEGVQYHPMLVGKRRREKGQASENRKVQVGLVGMLTKGRVLLQTARAVMRTMSGDRTVVMCLLDAGSQRSFITEELANRMPLNGPLEYVEIFTLGGQSKYCKRTRRVQFALSALDSGEQRGAKQWRTVEALWLSKICSPIQANPLLQRRWKHVYPRECSKIDVLIGLDYYYDFSGGVSWHAGEPVALRTLFGWIVCGSMGEGNKLRNVRSLHALVKEDPNEILRKFWDLEALGIRDAEEARRSQSTEAIRHYIENITFEVERYVPDAVNLPKNYKQANGRLFQIERKLSASRQTSTYMEAMDAYISTGWVEEVNYDNDRDVTRYLWRNMNTDIPPGIFRFIRLTFGLRSSTFLAIMVVQHHARLHIETYMRAAEEVLSNMSVDAFLTSCADSGEAEQLVDQLRKLMQLGGFNLTKWKCNSSSVAEAIRVTDVTANNDRIVSEVLGVPWNLGQEHCHLSRHTT
ncbi:DUF1758 domain containing protein [Trichuris trichiura]|uniref:DUF1758 domain containing protein n=1 Tax=Trichuris trichiura TaxID=36087 RepID=A0A077ZKR3_TRITR|nr:DUF1758 domain containing protein [Trichuris trichiura]